MFGFKDREDYWRQSTTSDRLKNIKVPCFYLHALDDIIMAPDSIPFEEFKKNPNLILGTTDKGGHCCHLHHGRTLKTSLLPV